MPLDDKNFAAKSLTLSISLRARYNIKSIWVLNELKILVFFIVNIDSRETRYKVKFQTTCTWLSKLFKGKIMFKRLKKAPQSWSRYKQVCIKHAHRNRRRALGRGWERGWQIFANLYFYQLSIEKNSVKVKNSKQFQN